MKSLASISLNPIDLQRWLPLSSLSLDPIDLQRWPPRPSHLLQNETQYNLKIKQYISDQY